MDIVFILDESYSTMAHKETYVKGINGFFSQQKSFNPFGKLTLLKFGSTVTAVCVNQQIDRLPEFTDKNFTPYGLTALYDAIGYGITLKQAEKNIIFIILTDGEENNSKNFTDKHLGVAIQTLTKMQNWNFVYISSGSEPEKSALSIGIDKTIRFSNSETSILKAINTCNSIVGRIAYSYTGVKNPYSEAVIQTDLTDVLESFGKINISEKMEDE